jgi:hypothetical protein
MFENIKYEPSKVLKIWWKNLTIKKSGGNPN